MTYCYILSENESSDISVAMNTTNCPESLVILNHVRISLADEARRQNFDSRSNTQNYEAQAHSTVCRLMAQIAKQFWADKSFEAKLYGL